MEDHVGLPVSPYAATKIAGEEICYTYSHLYGIRVACLRFFSVYGPRQRPDLAIRKFADMILAGQPLPTFGDGSTGRDYTYIDDIVAGVAAALRLASPYEIFNLGNSRVITLDQMIGALAHALGRKAAIARLPNQPGDLPQTFADISKSELLLGYRPQTPFEEGIQKFVDWYLSERESG